MLAVTILFALLALSSLVFAVVLLVKPPTWADARLAALAFGLLAAVSGAIAVLSQVRIRTHTPVNVSDINRIGDSDPEFFVEGPDRAYFAATGTLDAAGHHGSSAEPGIYSLTRKDHVVARVPTGELHSKPAHLAVVPGQTNTEALVFSVDTTVMLWDGTATVVAPASGTAAPLAIHGIKADHAGVYLLGTPMAGRLQLYEIDLASHTYAILAGTDIPGDSVSAFCACVMPSLLRSFLVTAGTTQTLWAWAGTGAPSRVGLTNPTRVYETPGGLLVAAGAESHVRLHFVAQAGSVTPYAFADSSQPPLVAVHAMATWHANDWVLASQVHNTSLWRVSFDKLVLVERLGNLDRPRLLTQLDGALGLVSRNIGLWLKQGTHDHNEFEPSNLDSGHAIPEMWTFDGLAWFTGRGCDEHGTDVGNELWYWGTD